MTGGVRTVRIFLSSPGDVLAERAAARDFLLGLAREPFLRDRVHIDVISWDDIHGGATMDARFTPQQAVARSLPKPGECDLTVVILWGRMGTPLSETKPDGTPYLSGTEWEFEDALTANKPLHVYRRAEKVLLDPDAPDFDDKLTQKRRVDAFFKTFAREDGTLLRAHASYATISDLEKLLRQDVGAYLNDLLKERNEGTSRGSTLRTQRGPQSRGDRPEVPIAYREWVKRQHGGVDLLGLQLKKGRPPSLSAIYVPQTTTAVPSDGVFPSDGREPVPDPGVVHLRHRERHTLALQRLAIESLYISGAPGTGKSTFCRWVAWLVAEGAVPALDVPPPDEFVEVLDEALKGRLPLLLRLREFWEYLPPRGGATLTVSDLENAIARWVDAKRPDGLDGELALAHLAHGSALVLLDGMDEVPVSAVSQAGKWLPRQQLLTALADACPSWNRAGNRLLLTSRPYGLSAEQSERTTLGLAPLQPLPYELQRLLAHRWFTVLAADPGAGAETAADLFSNIASQPWLVDLAANPLLLTAMCIVFDEGKRLPQDKHELYERVVATVLFSRYSTPADIDRAKRELGVIAYGMHTGAGFDQRESPRAEATFHEIERWLQQYQAQKAYTEHSESGAFDARDALLSHSGLFLSTDDDRAGFAHLSFQEFFAAQRALTVDEGRLIDVFVERGASPEWRNTLSFLFGRLLGASTEPEKAIELFERTLDVAARAEEPGLQLVLADAALMLGGKQINLKAERRELLQRLLLKGMTGAWAVATRAEAGTALGRLGDPRFRSDRFWLPDEDDLGFVEVAAGRFTMGSDPSVDSMASDDEQPQHLVDLPEYFIGRYPVTVAQFRAFVEDSGFPVGDADCLRGTPNHPVARVTFYDALAYCDWLTDRLRAADWTPPLLRQQFSDGWVITLPSEAEWEKAARGADERIYPWGDEFNSSNVNGAEAGLGGTSAVGMLLEGGSPFGLMDMSGNVWEWTRSLWGEDPMTPAYAYPYVPGDYDREDVQAANSVLRVVRGGSFNHYPNSLRAAYRIRSLPDAPGGYIGFRVVSSRLRR